MIAFLTSNPGGSIKKDGKRYPSCFNLANGFVDRLQSHWSRNAKILLISSDPDEFEITDSIKNNFMDSFPMSGLSIQKMDVCDHRDTKIVQRIKEYDVVILAGGHVPTQNAFFHEIELKQWISSFDGIVIGISAGTMNSAEVVYAQPELDGESIDPTYERFVEGLGITRYMVLPHYMDIKDEMLDGQRIIEDITFTDSMGKEIYALVDGSYLLIEDSITTLCGEAYLIADKTLRQICEEGKKLVLQA